MNAFEDIAGKILEEQRYWVRQSVKVDIAKEQKAMIGTATMPRPEIDLVAYNAADNQLVLFEVKSFFDSQGVTFAALAGENVKAAKRFKLFTNSKFREIVASKLKNSYLVCGLIRSDCHVRYGLIAGKIKKGDEEAIQRLFSDNGWILITPKNVQEAVRRLSEKGYEDNVLTIAAKILKE